MLINLLKKLLITGLILSAGTIHAAQPLFEDLTILVSSCDKYSPLWDPFFVSLFKQWPSLMHDNRELPIMLIANNKSFPNPRVKTINIPNEISWSDNMITALNQVNTKYVLVALDDYWINAPVNEQRLYEIYNTMQHEDAAMLQVSVNEQRWQPGVEHGIVPNLLYTDKFKHYKATLQLAIWNTEALKFLLRPGESPWDFELAGTARSHGYPKPFLSLAGDEPITYMNAVQQGYVHMNAMLFTQQQQIPFEPGALTVLGKNRLKVDYQLWKNKLTKALKLLNTSAYYPYSIEQPK